MSIDTLGDFLTIIRNGVRASKRSVLAPHSVRKEKIAAVLKQEGYIRDFVIEEEGSRKYLKVILKYSPEGESVIHSIKRVSVPGCRTYSPVARIKPVIGGLGITILTTSRGIITDKQARELGVGGEVICTVW